jgi:hypothetical protein
MPHTNRKNPLNARSKPHLVHIKRQQIEDDDGWTHIVDAPRRSTRAKGKDRLHAGDFEKNGASYINRTLEEVRKDFEHYTQQWENNEACEALKKTLGEVEGKRKVSSVVVLGLGSLQSARREGRRASYTQLAALRTLIQNLGMPSEILIPSFADEIKVTRNSNASSKIPSSQTSTASSSRLWDIRWWKTLKQLARLRTALWCMRSIATRTSTWLLPKDHGRR